MPSQSAQRQDPIDRWAERDLTRASAAGELRPAYEVDWPLDQIAEVLETGRNPIVTGEAGVGKTAVIHEWIRRRSAEEEQGTKVLQFSLHRMAGSLRKEQTMGDLLNELIDALVARTDVLPYFRDIHLAYDHDLESHFQTLAYQLERPILAEAERMALSSLLEYCPEIEQHFVPIYVEEPSLDRMESILEHWAKDKEAETGLQLAPPARREALYLCHRFVTTQRMPRKAILFLDQVCSLAREDLEISPAMVIDRFALRHKIPRALIDPVIELDLEEVRQHFGQNLLGQDEALNAVVRTISAIKAGLTDMRRPFGVFLFVGPTGVGKTHLAQLLAEYLFGNRQHVLRFNMGDYAGENAPRVLFGDPHGGQLSHKRGTLTTRLQGHPFSVILLDEFEKAHASVHDGFLQLVDEGCFINAAGETVSCRSSILILTSNAGAEYYRQHPFGFVPGETSGDARNEIDRALRERFRFELLNRFDQVVHFTPLSRETIRTIARRELSIMESRPGLLQRGLTLEVDEAVLDWLAVNGYDPHYGARFLRRTIEKDVVNALAEAIVRRRPAEGDMLQLTVRRNRVEASVAHPSLPTRKEPKVSAGAASAPATWDAGRLLEESRKMVGKAAPLFAALESIRGEHGKLIEEMNSPGFWDNRGDREQVLDRFRELDVALQIQERLAAPLRRLEGLLAAGKQPLAPLVEQAADALRDWETRLLEDDVTSAWLLVAGDDPLKSNTSWVSDVAAMELAWCRSKGLSAGVVAADPSSPDAPNRVVLEVEGPGLTTYLRMEEGVHRLAREPGQHARARVHLVPQRKAGEGKPPPIENLRTRNTRFDLPLRYRTQIQVEQKGMTLVLAAKDDQLLSHLANDLAAYLATETVVTRTPVRRYGEDGTGARDPETGVVAPRLKDVLQGRLEKFHEAWLARQSGGA